MYKLMNNIGLIYDSKQLMSIKSNIQSILIMNHLYNNNYMILVIEFNAYNVLMVG